MTQKNIKQLINFIFLSAEGFSCRLDFLNEGLGLGKLKFLTTKRYKKFSAVCFFQFLVIKTLDKDSEPDRDSLEMLDPDPQDKTG